MTSISTINWHKLNKAVYLGLLLCVMTFSVSGQDNPMVAAEEVLMPTAKHDIRKATMLSVFIPGAGQIYNRKWWKTPIVYAGLGTTIYLAVFNQREYRVYSDAFDQRRDSNTPPDRFDGILNEQQLIANMRFHQGNRDLSFVFMAVIYGLNIIDANVDAHLFDFDISDDLTLKVNPKAWQGQAGMIAGLGLTFQIR
jgi:hypothetical protein